MATKNQQIDTDDYHGPSRRVPEPLGWHLKKEVNLSIIISMLGIALTGFYGFAELKKDVELLKANARVLHERDTKLETDLKEAMTLVREQYREMSNKIDRIIERIHKDK